MTKLAEIDDPQGGRNKIRSGDAVKVLRGGADKTGFSARFCHAVERDGAVVEVVVYGGRGFDPAAPGDGGSRAKMRSLRPERIARMSQAHVDRRRC